MAKPREDVSLSPASEVRAVTLVFWTGRLTEVGVLQGCSGPSPPQTGPVSAVFLGAQNIPEEEGWPPRGSWAHKDLTLWPLCSHWTQ